MVVLPPEDSDSNRLDDTGPEIPPDPDSDLLDDMVIHNLHAADLLHSVATALEVMLVGMGASIEQTGPAPEELDAVFCRLVACACDLRRLAAESEKGTT